MHFLKKLILVLGAKRYLSFSVKYVYTFEHLNGQLTNQTLTLLSIIWLRVCVSEKRVLLLLNGSIIFIPRATVRNRYGMVEEIASGTVKYPL